MPCTIPHAVPYKAKNTLHLRDKPSTRYLRVRYMSLITTSSDRPKMATNYMRTWLLEFRALLLLINRDCAKPNYGVVERERDVYGQITYPSRRSRHVLLERLKRNTSH